MVAVHLTDRERTLLERVCEQQRWHDLRRKLAVECAVCRGLKAGACDHTAEFAGTNA